MTERTLDLAPRNATLTELAVELSLGNAVGAVLEPGDATRYDLLLVPCWTESVSPVAVGTGDRGGYLLVGIVAGSQLAVLPRHAHWTYVLEKLRPHRDNEHSAAVVADFLDLVWAELERLDRA
jgi:hypothetical protein